MLRLSRVFKNYNETGSLSEQINLYGFIGPHVFLTKSGEVGVILEVHGVDYECLDDASIDGFTKRLESALKLFDENYRLYQYLFKRNNEAIPYKLYANPIVDTAIKNRIAYLAGKADTLFSLSVYYVVLYHGFQTSAKLGSALAEFPKKLELYFQTFQRPCSFCISIMKVSRSFGSSANRRATRRWLASGRSVSKAITDDRLA